MLKKVFILLLLSSFCTFSYAQSAKTLWVDSVFNALNINERIGQLFMVPVSSNANANILDEIKTNIKIHKIGGILFTQGTPVRQTKLTNSFQQSATLPLFIAQDAEWGLGTSIDSTINLPPALLLGALRDDTLVYKTASLIANQLKSIGVNLNFAPVTEVHRTQETLLNYRSFGESKINVANKSLAFMRGLQDHGVLSCAKHFPLEGLTIIDVQKGFPILKISADSLQAYPYTKLFENGLTGVMPAAAQFPLFYENVNVSKKNTFNSSTLTSVFTGDWIKKNMGYTGLTFVYIQKVQLVTDKYRAGEAELFAFQAGNDVLVAPKDIGPAIRKIRRLVRKEKKYQEQVNASVRKILEAKFNAGLWRYQPANVDNITLRLNSSEALLLKQKVYEKAITVVRNTKNILPIKILENKKFAYVTSETIEPNDEFYKYLSKYVPIPHYIADEKTNFVSLLDSLVDKDVIVVSIFPQTQQSVIERLHRILNPLSKSDIIFCDFGNAFFLRTASQYPTVVTAYTNTPLALKSVPQIIFGGLAADGVLPISISNLAKEGTGVKTPAINRLTYSIPEDAKMDSRILQKIDTIAAEAIKMGATPGCQVFVAKDGKVIYQKAFGHLTYDTSTMPVNNQTIYDLASVTKVSATLQTAMFMHERGLIDLHKKVSHYLPDLKKSNKKDITLIDMLTHQSGLLPFIPLWPQTVKDTTFLPLYYSRVKNEQYPLQVSPNLYASPNIRDSVWVWITKSKLNDKPARTPYSYKYSDLGFLILQHLAEKILNQPMEDFLQQNLYEPLGAHTTGFTPLNRFPKHIIAPTEDDKIYRRTFVSGTVHDERAAMLGGIAGHAGLFSNANDLGKLGQMLLQEGSYGGYQYYKPETIRLFTAKKFQTSRRGIGWDKPIQSDWNSPTSLFASPQTFGHTGFTGTCIWIDPEFNLVYIFLSNRVYPDRNNKLSNANIRSRIQDVIYQSIFNYYKYEDPHYIISSTAQ